MDACGRRAAGKGEHIMDRGIAVVTGAGSGIGAATARTLAAEGYEVVCAGRRLDRLEAVAAGIGGRAVRCDVTDQASVDALLAAVGDRCDLLVNNAGGAIGLEPVAEADLTAWDAMFATNVTGAARVTQAFLPLLEAGEGTVIFVTSTAAEAGYEGGAGYCAAKAAERFLVNTLRLELCGKPVRVCEVSPGMVHTAEFALVRFGGDQVRADAVYDGVPEPLEAEDIADAIGWMATRPAHVNIDRMVVRPRAQAANHKLYRVG